MKVAECGIHKLIADITLLSEGKVLLLRYKATNKYDHQQGWFLPDDTLNHEEHPDKAAKRILKEQLSLSLPKIHLMLIDSFKGNDGSWHLAFHYKAEMDEIPMLTPSDEVETMEWFSLDKLPPRTHIAHNGWALSTIRKVAGSLPQAAGRKIGIRP